ncbi:MAG: 3'-5' exonuclease [Prevotellaceae bacterium]|jgi:DNA polymerase-3 subunit epsilon|nr:3'-5' exonuclease [Prevotellaceae bacterium]
MKLNLTNPIIIFDLETTGLNLTADRIVEISAIKIHSDGSEEIKTRRINPGMPIPAESTAIHKITDEDVKDCPMFGNIAKSLAAYIEGCDLVGYNLLKFDIPLLAEEFLRAGVNIDFRKVKIIDVQNIFHKMEQRTLVAAYKFYCNKILEDAHNAEADTKATYEILQSQLDRYPELKNEVKFLSEFSVNNKNFDYANRIGVDKDNEPVFNFGKYKGRKVKEIFRLEPSYYSWIMNGEFTLDTKKVFTEIRSGMLQSPSK